MPDRVVLEPPSTATLVELLARSDPGAIRPLAELVLGILEGPFFRAVVDARFVIRAIDLHASSPSFPGATVVADGLAPMSPLMLARTVEVDRDAFLATPVLVISGRERTVAEVLAAAARPDAAETGGATLVMRACVRAVARVVLDAVAAIGPSIDELRPLLAHHTVPDGASLFIPRDAALNTLGFDAPLDGGLSWAMAARLVRPRVAQGRVFYEVGDPDPARLLFTMRASADERVDVLARLGAGPLLEVGAHVPGLFDRYVRFVVALQLAPYARLRLWIDDEQVASARGEASGLERLVGRQSIGAGVLGRHRSALFLRELLLVGSPLGPTARARVSRRLARHVLDAPALEPHAGKGG